MKKTFLIFILLFIYQENAHCQYWEKLDCMSGPIQNMVTNSNGDVFFVANKSDTIYNVAKDSQVDSLNYIWKLPANSQNPVICYGTVDIIKEIFITKKNTVLAFTCTNTSSIEFDGVELRMGQTFKSLIRSSDNGNSWNTLNLNLEGESKIYENANHYLFLTGTTPNLYTDFVGSDKIYMSKDEGLTWENTNWNKGRVQYFNLMKDGKLIVVSDTLLFTSKDNGLNWNAAYNIDKRIYFNYVTLNHSGTWFSNMSLRAVTHNIYKSDDSGRTWKNFNYLQDDTLNNFIIMPNDEMYSLSKYRFLFKSTDNGNSWSSVLDMKSIIDTTSAYRFFEYNNTLYILAYSYLNRTFRIYQYDASNNKLTDNFGSIFDELIHDFNEFQFLNNQFYLDKNGILLLTNNDSHFFKISLKDNHVITDFYPVYPFINNAYNKMFTTLLLTPKNAIIIDIVDKNSNRLRFISRNAGLTWKRVTDSIFIGNLYLSKNGNIYTAYNRFIYVSTDDGSSFRRIGKPFRDIDTLSGNKYDKIGVSPKGFIYLYNYRPLLMSTDEGETWLSRKGNDSLQWWNYIEKIKFDNSENIFTYNSVFTFNKSSDFGDSWVPIYKVSDYGSNYDIAPNGDICIAYFLISKSVDHGSTWVKIRDYGQIENYFKMAVNNDGVIFTNRYHSNDLGNTWIRNGKAGMVVYNSQNTIMYDDDYPMNFFRFLKPTTIQNEFVNNPTNLSISPNPATDYIEINIFEINRRVNPTVDKVEIYDILGILYTPPNPILIEGEQLRLDVSGFVPGVYFVKIGDKVRKYVKM